MLLHLGVRDVPEDLPRARQVERRLGARRAGQLHEALRAFVRTRMLGVGGRRPGHLRQELPAPDPHGRREPGRLERSADSVEPVREAGVRRAEPRAYLARGGAVADQRDIAGLPNERHPPAENLQAPREVAYARLGGVVADDPQAGAAGEADRRVR
ncbi:MAG: hypothetical protein OXH52_15275 [Gammaproteobacteria bacterium]|nr:hypothetical protein [Gammaproteobacteria bacterium]